MFAPMEELHGFYLPLQNKDIAWAPQGCKKLWRIYRNRFWQVKEKRMRKGETKAKCLEYIFLKFNFVDFVSDCSGRCLGHSYSFPGNLIFTGIRLLPHYIYRKKNDLFSINLINNNNNTGSLCFITKIGASNSIIKWFVYFIIYLLDFFFLSHLYCLYK